MIFDNNSLITDYQYIQYLSPRLQLFKKLSSTEFTCRCPVCGDSAKSPNKTRFYFLKERTYWRVFCHNCGYPNKIKYFLKECYPDLYVEYCKDEIKEKIQPSKNKVIDSSKIKNALQESLKTVEESNSIDYTQLKRFIDLPLKHPARVYTDGRGITEEDIWYAPKFSSFLEEVDENKKYEIYYDRHEPRIIIPFWSVDGVSNIFQARCFGSEFMRYITIKFDDDQPKIFGLNRADFSQPIYIVEGPIDSFFLPNCIAMGGSSTSGLPDGEYIYCYDNEPRNSQITQQMNKRIVEKKKIWIPSDDWKYKDLNQAYVDGGMSKQSIEMQIVHNTFSGISAKVRMSKWKKC